MTTDVSIAYALNYSYLQQGQLYGGYAGDNLYGYDSALEYSGDRTQFDYYAANIFPCKRTPNSSNFVRYTPIDEINDTNLESGLIDRALLEYKSNVSIYLQDLVKRDRSQITAADDLWLMPTLTYYNSNTGATYYYADYFYYAQSVLNGTAAARHPVVTLTYTILK